VVLKLVKKTQAGAELCQAQDQHGLTAEAKLMLEVFYILDCAGGTPLIHAKYTLLIFTCLGNLDYTKCCKAWFAHFQLLRSSSIQVVFH
jgi:hypothetical protein